MPRRKLEGTYYSRNRERVLAQVREYQKGKTEQLLLQGAKNRAQHSGRDFELELEDIKIPNLCPVFGTPMKSPSIDRVDNNKGYTKDNIRIISLRANKLKSDATLEELKAIIRYMDPA